MKWRTEVSQAKGSDHMSMRAWRGVVARLISDQAVSSRVALALRTRHKKLNMRCEEVVIATLCLITILSIARKVDV